MVSIPMHHRGTLLTVGNRLVPIDFTNLVALWTFGEGSGTTLYDRSGNGYNATINASCGWTWDSTKKKWTVCFDGSDDIMNAGDCIDFGDEDFSIVGWFSSNNLDRDTGGVLKTGSYDWDACNYGFSPSGGGFVFVVSDSSGTGGSATKLSTGSLSTGVWYFLVGVYDSSAQEVSLYLDGSLVDGPTAVNTLPAPNDQDLVFGHFPGSTNYYSGRMGLVLAYRRLMSSSEITAFNNKIA